MILQIILFILLIFILDENLKLKLMSFVPIKNDFIPTEYVYRNIALVTAEDRDEDYIKYHDQSLQKYSDKYHYDYLRYNNCDTSEASTYWCKIYKVLTALKTGKYDYVLWADSDTIIINDKDLNDIISDFGEPDIIISENFLGWTKGNIYFLQNISLDLCNAGLFIIKNSEVGINFINDCIAELDKRPWCIKDGKEQGPWAGICYEEGIMNKLIKQKYSKFTYLDKNADLVLTVQEGVVKDLDYNNIYGHPLFIHLNGHSKETRNEVFSHFV